jgi:hypothetical protein
MIYGLTINNNPTSSDLWNSAPAWGFPFTKSFQAPRPKASTLIDGRARQRTFGASAFASWNDLVYLEAGAYEGLSDELLNALGKVPVTGADRFKSALPYGRLAFSQNWGQAFAQVGAFALAGKIMPRGLSPLGRVNKVTDLGVDANFQYIWDPSKVSSDIISASALLIRETTDAQATAIVAGSLAKQSLQTFRANVSYSFGATITPTIQYFRTVGARDARFWGTSSGRPDTDGMIYEIAYVPWGKPETPPPIEGLNARLVAQYTDYFSFDGSRVDIRKYNSLFVGATTALAF